MHTVREWPVKINFDRPFPAYHSSQHIVKIGFPKNFFDTKNPYEQCVKIYLERYNDLCPSMNIVAKNVVIRL